ncbi:MAG: TraB/GumN family protein [Treponema sp.]|jgi:pheromone shutdown-related protein TraB|nr:TraB/GumN family protein [Treponema sp.]
MNTNNVHLTLANREIHLIGTAHVSRESIDEVTGAIRGENPGMVCVELDESRYAAITKQDSWEKLNITKVLKEGKGFLLIANLTLSGFQRRMGNELGVKPGEEMIAAVNAAKEMGIDFSLCDREIHLTLRRAWACCSLWSKCKLLAALLSSAFVTEKLSAQEIENLKNSSELDNMMDELAKYLPAVKETLIDERDRYLATKIWAASGQSKNEAGTLAVVGAGHLRGIQAWLEKFASEAPADPKGLAELETIPPKTLLSKAARWIIPALILAVIAAGFLRSFLHADFSEFQNMLRLYVLWNGGLAALGAVLALAHPLAVLVSFLCAPFTSLNPFIGVGMLSGLVQVVVRKPQVSDAENISADSASLKGLYRNRITRVLLVFFLSSLGSSIATFISGPVVVNSLIKIFKGD